MVTKKKTKKSKDNIKVTTKPIKVDDEVKKKLDGMKKHPRETYNDTLRIILKLNGERKNDRKSY